MWLAGAALIDWWQMTVTHLLNLRVLHACVLAHDTYTNRHDRNVW